MASGWRAGFGRAGWRRTYPSLECHRIARTSTGQDRPTRPRVAEAGFLGMAAWGRGPLHHGTRPNDGGRGRQAANRERECLVGDLTRIVNRMKGTLARLGIRKAGNARVRRGMIQLAWRFLPFQKESALAWWYHARTCRPGTQAPHRALALCHDWRDIGGRHLASGGLNGPRQSISLPIWRSRWHSGQ